MSLSDEALAFLLVIAAGGSTAIGASVVYSKSLIHLARKEVLGGSLGLAAGVMLYVSFVEIFNKSVGAFEDSGISYNNSYLYATICFFSGAIIMKAIDALVHVLDPAHMAHDDLDFEMIQEIVHRQDEEDEKMQEIADGRNPVATSEEKDSNDGDHMNGIEIGELAATPQEATLCSTKSEPDTSSERKKEVDAKLSRMGLLTALAIAIHNFPEGLATFVATLNDPAVGAALAVAIAIHNIPEGLCVSVPIYYATGDRHKAFMWGVLSGVSEIVGAGLGWLILKDLFEDVVYGILFGLVAGMMVYICIFSLLPTARRYDPQDIFVSNLVVVGMVIMAISLVAFFVLRT